MCLGVDVSDLCHSRFIELLGYVTKFGKFVAGLSVSNLSVPFHPSSFQDLHYIYIRTHDDTSHVSQALPFFSFFFSCLFLRLDHFSGLIFKFANSFFCLPSFAIVLPSQPFHWLLLILDFHLVPFCEICLLISIKPEDCMISRSLSI